MIHAICKKSYFANHLMSHYRDGSWIFVTNSILGALFGGFVKTKNVFRCGFMSGIKISRSLIHQDVIYIDLDEFQTVQCKFKDDRKIEFSW